MNQLKNIFLILPFFIFSFTARAAEPWKGHTQVSPVELGLLTGFSLYGTDTNWSVLATGAYLLNEKGFAEDLDNRIWLELEMGPAFFSTGQSSQTGLQYSAHLRWDFTLNEYWTFYGLGGLGGYVLPSFLKNTFLIHPRFGAGAEYQTKTALLFRGELSQDFMGLGIALNF